MDIAEADRLLGLHLSELRVLPYSELKRLVEGRIIQTPVVKGALDILYHLEVQAFWDTRSQGNVRVVVSIDDGRRGSHLGRESAHAQLDDSFSIRRQHICLRLQRSALDRHVR